MPGVLFCARAGYARRMAYATQADLEDACGGSARLVQISDWDGDRVADTARITAALTAAQSEIDTYLAKQRYVPLATPYPRVVVDLCARIARYRLAGSRGMQTEDYREDYTNDVKWLGLVADGSVKLDVDPQPTKASDRIDSYTSRPSSKDVSREKLAGFK